MANGGERGSRFNLYLKTSGPYFDKSKEQEAAWGGKMGGKLDRKQGQKG